MFRKYRYACSLLTVLTLLVATSAQAQIPTRCVPDIDQGVVQQGEYPHTSCFWQQNPGQWAPPTATQVQLLTAANDCILLECAAPGPWENGAWIGKLKHYWAPWQSGTWDNQVYWSKLGWRVRANFHKDECDQGVNFGPQDGPASIVWDHNQGHTAGISSVICGVVR